MKKVLSLLVILGLVSGTLRVGAQISETNSFTNLNQLIPDGNSAGLHDVRTVSSAITNLTSVRLKLRVAGEFNGDLYGYVRHTRGATTNFCVLLNRAGRTLANANGYADAGLIVTLDDAAPNGDIHQYRTVTTPAAGTPLTGNWRPDGRKVDPEVALDTTARTATFSSFTNAPADGEWTLYLADLAAGGTNMLVNWELEFTGIARPAVTWPTPADLVYGTALSGTQLNASSPVPGTFAYNPPAGTVLNASNNQTLSVTFTPTDTLSYVVVTTNVSLNVLKKALTITAVSTNKVYGAALPVLRAGYVGFVNGDTTNNLTAQAVLSTTATAASVVGGYPITVGGATSLNYTIGYVAGTLTVDKATLTITAVSTNKVYGAALPVLRAGYVGFVNGDTTNNLTAQAVLSTTATAASPVGGYPITVSGATSLNYTIGFVAGTLTVDKAALTITASNRAKTYGDAVVFAGSEFSPTGLVNSDTVTSVTLSSAGAAGTATVAGSPYTIVPSAAVGTGLGNYTIGYANGTLTVTPAALTGLVTSSANPALPGQAVSFTLTLSASTATGVVQFKIDGSNAGGPVALSGGVGSYASSTLTHGPHTVRAEYAGDGNFVGTTNLLAPAQLINTLPVAGADTIERGPTNTVKVAIATLLTNDTDADGDAVAYLSANASSANGGTVVSNAGWLFYTPAVGFTNADTFTYTISDGFGVPVIGTVTVNIRLDNGPSPNLTISDLGGGTYSIRGDGIPGRTYRIEFATNPVTPSWQPLGVATADPAGWFALMDTSGSPQRFYRSVYP